MERDCGGGKCDWSVSAGELMLPRGDQNVGSLRNGVWFAYVDLGRAMGVLPSGSERAKCRYFSGKDFGRLVRWRNLCVVVVALGVVVSRRARSAAGKGWGDRVFRRERERRSARGGEEIVRNL